MSEAPPHVVRPIEKSEISQALDIWRETGLQEGTKCLDTWLEVDPEGFWVAVSDAGELLGVCTAVVHHDDFAFVGCYAVREKYRGQGIGIEIWNACYKHIGERNAGVNAVPGKKELYRDRGGFPIEETRWLSVSSEMDEKVDTNVLVGYVDGVEARPILDEDLPLVLEYDASLVGYRRDKAITLTVHEDDNAAFLAVRDNACVGYGVIKMSVQGHGMIGPLYADNQDIAELLLRRLIEGFPQGKGLVLMIISSNECAKSIASKVGLELHEECPRCYKRYTLNIDTSKVFGQLDLNFSPC